MPRDPRTALSQPLGIDVFWVRKVHDRDTSRTVQQLEKYVVTISPASDCPDGDFEQYVSTRQLTSELALEFAVILRRVPKL